MSEAAFAEIGPISKDGEDMFRMIVMPFGGKVVRFDSERDLAVVKFPDREAVEHLEMPGYFVNTLAEDPTAPKAEQQPEQQPQPSLPTFPTNEGNDVGQHSAADSAGGSPRTSTMAAVVDGGTQLQQTIGGLASPPTSPPGLSSPSAKDLPSSASSTTASSISDRPSIAMRKRIPPTAASSGLEPLPASDPFYLLTDMHVACPLTCGFLLLYTLSAIIAAM